MEYVLSALIGIGLASACGFRVFVPPFLLSIAALAGHVNLGSGFDWMGTWPAVALFGVATAMEIVAYYVPWLDNLLDTMATPMAVVAGIAVTASVVGDMSPMLRWTLAVIAGGGAAGIIQLLTVKARGISSVVTLGTGNPILSTAETAGSIVLSLVSIIFPFLVVFVLVVFVLLIWRIMAKRSRARQTAQTSS